MDGGWAYLCKKLAACRKCVGQCSETCGGRDSDAAGDGGDVFLDLDAEVITIFDLGHRERDPCFDSVCVPLETDEMRAE